MARSSKPTTLTVDIHEMSTLEARRYLERLIASCGSEVREIEIIHGYHSGRALLETVRSGVRSKRIERRCVTMNPGVTIYFLKSSKS